MERKVTVIISSGSWTRFLSDWRCNSSSYPPSLVWFEQHHPPTQFSYLNNFLNSRCCIIRFSHILSSHFINNLRIFLFMFLHIMTRNTLKLHRNNCYLAIIIAAFKLVSTPGSFRTRKESLVHTVCACAKIPRNPGNFKHVAIPLEYWPLPFSLWPRCVWWSTT